jgi:hypothetical protein
VSIASLIVQPDAAYLLTDSGMYDEDDGKLLWLHPKVLPAPGVPFAYAAVGEAAAVLVRVAGEMLKRPTRFYPAAFRDLVREVYAELGADPVRHYLRFVAAGFWAGEPVGLTMFTNPADALPGEEPWTWYDCRYVIQPYFKQELQELGLARELDDPAVFDPWEDSMRLVNAYREKRHGWGADGSKSGCYVAGKIVLTVVSDEGVLPLRIHEYPDKVGELAGV